MGKGHRQPEPGWTTQAEVVRVIDGDTVVIEIRRQVHVRLLDCWCPESRTTNLAEKARGMAAKQYVGELLKKLGRKVLAYIPADPTLNLSHEFTLGRVLGRIWLADGRELSAAVRAAGHATSSKQSKPGQRPGRSLAGKPIHDG